MVGVGMLFTTGRPATGLDRCVGERKKTRHAGGGSLEGERGPEGYGK